MDNHRNAPQGIHAQRDEPLLAGCVGVFDRESAFIAQRLFGMGKAHAMLAKVAARLGWVKFKRNSPLCILNAYCQEHGRVGFTGCQN